ncbi:MAG TPA: LytR C-terminal domain-containing protein [Patescibacteria group bacterium]|nr:LytR C-terminal domain-containing protein [Patescibacteria group bacterium]
MEEQENQSVETEQEVQSTPFQSQESSSGVSFPTVGQPKKSGGAKTLLIVGALVLIAILGFVIYKSANKNSTDTSSDTAPFDNLTTPSTDQTVITATPMPSAAAKVDAAKIDKTKIQIQIQNGTGISGEASYLQTQLKALGYTNVKTGNSSSTVTATTVTFSSTLDSSVVSEITQKLNSIYQTVTVSTSSSTTFDVVVVTGLRKGATPKPSTTPTAVPSASPSASASPTT